MPAPEYPLGTEVEYRVDGENVLYRVVDVSGGDVTWEDSKGCSFVQAGGDPVLPTLEWDNCGGGSGTHTLGERTGSLWPLELGKTASYAASGRNANGDSWSHTRRCEVADTVSLTVPAGTYDAFEVVCRDRSSTRTWYFAPDVGTYVGHVRQPRGGSTLTLELASEPAIAQD